MKSYICAQCTEMSLRRALAVDELKAEEATPPQTCTEPAASSSPTADTHAHPAAEPTAEERPLASREDGSSEAPTRESLAAIGAPTLEPVFLR
jgi:hypothetical protein